MINRFHEILDIPDAEKGVYTVIYTYDKNPSIFCHIYIPHEDFWMVMENCLSLAEETPEIAEIIPHRVDPVEKEDNSRWIKHWRVG